MRETKKNVVIFGVSGHAQVIADIIEAEGAYALIGFIGGTGTAGKTILGYPVLGNDEELPEIITRHSLSGFVIGIGDNYSRHSLQLKMKRVSNLFFPVRAIHPRATISRNVSIGAGSVIMAGAVVNVNAKIGDACILNTNSSLDHDSTMDDASSLGPNAAVAGNCHLGTHAAIGMSASIRQGVVVGEHSVIGMCANVLRDVPSCRIAHGNPARIISERNPGDKYL